MPPTRSSLVRTIRGGCKLTTSSEAIGHESFEQDWVEICASKVDRGGVSSWTRADDDL